MPRGSENGPLREQDQKGRAEIAKRGIGSQNSSSSPATKQVRARVEHVFARMKTGKILRDCRHRSDGVQHSMRGIARLHNLNLAG